VPVGDFVESNAKRNLGRRLKEGALANAQRDLEIAQEWFPLEEEAWQRTTPGKRAAQLTIPARATSASST
jgi:hypothetical protein